MRNCPDTFFEGQNRSKVFANKNNLRRARHTILATRRGEKRFNPRLRQVPGLSYTIDALRRRFFARSTSHESCQRDQSVRVRCARAPIEKFG